MTLRGPSVTKGVSFFDIYESDQLIEQAFQAGLDEEKPWRSCLYELLSLIHEPAQRYC